MKKHLLTLIAIMAISNFAFGYHFESGGFMEETIFKRGKYKDG